MTNTTLKFDVTNADFDLRVLSASKTTPVLVDFWASWCAPCRTLMPMLDKLVGEFNGAFLLAKVNTDQQREIATRYQIRSLPTVMLFKDGTVVDQFMGALPESDIRAFLVPYIAQPDTQQALAASLIGAGKLDEAKLLLEQQYKNDPSDSKIAFELADLYLLLKTIPDAQRIYSSLPVNQAESDIGKKMATNLHLAMEISQALSLEQAHAALAHNNQDSEALYSLSLHEIEQQQYKSALDRLLQLMALKKDYKDGVAHKTIIHVFNLLNKQPDFVNEYRRKMARLLY